jgi:hypothetical protein
VKKVVFKDCGARGGVFIYEGIFSFIKKINRRNLKKE